ncbi:hypothetical protein [Brevibacillus sp. 179-C9.3 HS]|uniref:hypothetical protein n=1 Tax=unclassified Brevibacillus TaxID=2684853 RepID=UPI00399F5769
MDFPSVTISSDALKNALTDCVNSFIEIEKSQTGLSYQQKSNFVRGQIALLSSFLGDHWDYKSAGQSYYEFLIELVEKYSLEVEDIRERLSLS